MPRPLKPAGPFRYFNSSPEVIRLVVMMYVRFPLSLRNVEDLLFERGIDICHETVRMWWNRFGPMFAGDIRRQRVSRMRGFRHWRWHLDEMYVKLNGEMVYLWRAVDHEGEILESYITKTRDKNAALTFMKKALKRHGSPKRITTDGLRSYRAAMNEIGNGEKQEVGRWANNRVENSHLSFRRRERAMLRFNVRDCTFANHLDDALNVHGIYVRIIRSTTKNTLSCELSDFQQRGVRLLRVGDEVSVADAENLDIKYRGSVAGVTYADDLYLTVTVDTDLPDQIREGDVINNVTRNAGVNFTRNSVSANRARGILLSTLGPVLVEECRFHTPGSAIRISGGVDFWYESGPTANVTVRNNIFDNCKYGVWGAAVIEVDVVDGKKSTSRIPYHGRVAITGNRFIAFDGLLVRAYRVGTLRFASNIVEKSTAYPEFRTVSAPVETNAVETLEVSHNAISGFSFTSVSREVPRWRD